MLVVYKDWFGGVDLSASPVRFFRCHRETVRWYRRPRDLGSYLGWDMQCFGFVIHHLHLNVHFSTIDYGYIYRRLPPPPSIAYHFQVGSIFDIRISTILLFEFKRLWTFFLGKKLEHFF